MVAGTLVLRAIRQDLVGRFTNEHVLAAKDSDVRISVREGWRDSKYRWIHTLTNLLAGKQMREYYGN